MKSRILKNKILKKYLESFLNHDEDLVERYVDVSGAVIIKQDEKGNNLLLLIRRAPSDRWPHVWEFPRGKCEGKESINQCLKREVKEETNLDVEIVSYINKYEYIADEGKRKSTQYNYLCKLKNKNQEVELSHEHSEYKWITTFAEAELMVPVEMKKTIYQVFNIDKPLISYEEEETQTINERI